MIHEEDIIVTILLLDPIESPFTAAFPVFGRSLENNRMAFPHELSHVGLTVEILDPRQWKRTALPISLDPLQHSGLEAFSPVREQTVHALTGEEVIRNEKSVVTAAIARHEPVRAKLRVPGQAAFYHLGS